MHHIHEPYHLVSHISLYIDHSPRRISLLRVSPVEWVHKELLMELELELTWYRLWIRWKYESELMKEDGLNKWNELHPHTTHTHIHTTIITIVSNTSEHIISLTHLSTTILYLNHLCGIPELLCSSCARVLGRLIWGADTVWVPEIWHSSVKNEKHTVPPNHPKMAQHKGENGIERGWWMVMGYKVVLVWILSMSNVIAFLGRKKSLSHHPVGRGMEQYAVIVSPTQDLFICKLRLVLILCQLRNLMKVHRSPRGPEEDTICPEFDERTSSLMHFSLSCMQLQE